MGVVCIGKEEVVILRDRAIIFLDTSGVAADDAVFNLNRALMDIDGSSTGHAWIRNRRVLNINIAN